MFLWVVPRVHTRPWPRGEKDLVSMVLESL